MRKYWMLPGLLFCTLSVALWGCGSGQQEEERREVGFTVASEDKLPEELKGIIEKNRKKEMRMTYKDGEDLYLIRGYGEQKTGGYSIAVAECAEDAETVWFDTRLIGPQDTEQLREEPSYPWVAVKIEMREKEVVIE